MNSIRSKHIVIGLVIVFILFFLFSLGGGQKLKLKIIL